MAGESEVPLPGSDFAGRVKMVFGRYENRLEGLVGICIRLRNGRPLALVSLSPYWITSAGAASGRSEDFEEVVDHEQHWGISLNFGPFTGFGMDRATAAGRR
jgi:hypothetical protein